MKEFELKDELPLISIETDLVPPDGELRLTDIPFSVLVSDHYKMERKNQAKLLKVAPKERNTNNQNNNNTANFDALTGLLNPRYMSLLIKESFQQAKASDKFFAFLYLQVNGLNGVKSKYDDSFVNEVLITVAKRLKLTIRNRDYLSYLNGNKYLIALLIEKNRLQIVESIIEKINKNISTPMNINEKEIKFSINSSVAAYPIHGDKLSVLLDIAKMKMYQLNKSAK